MNHHEDLMDSAITDQMAALGEVMSAGRYEMTDFEVDLWIGIATSVPKAQFLAFLKHHVLSSPFPPKPSDAQRHFGVSADPAVVFEALVRLVKEFGPWRKPEGLDPVLVATIQALGGWIAVNEQLPDTSQPHAVRAYRERFDACFTASISQVNVRRQLPQQELIPLGNNPDRSQNLISRPSA